MGASISEGSVFGISSSLTIVLRIGRSLSQALASAKSESDWIHCIARRSLISFAFDPIRQLRENMAAPPDRCAQEQMTARDKAANVGEPQNRNFTRKGNEG